MGKQIQIVGQNVRPVVLKELDLNANGIFTFLKPSEDDVVEVNNSEFIRAIKDIDTFNKWVVEYKRDENTIIPLRIDKIEKKVIEPSSELEFSITTLNSLEAGNYEIGLDGTLTLGNNYVYVERGEHSDFARIIYGLAPYHAPVYISLLNLADGEVQLEEISEEFTGESANTRLISARKDGDKLYLVLEPWNSEEVIATASDETPKTEWHFSFTNDDVDVSAITLVKLEVVYTIEDDSIVATYVDETKEIEAGTVLPTPSGTDDGKLLGVADGAYALVNNPIPSVSGDDKDKYLHTNAESGALEWAEVSGGGSNEITIELANDEYSLSLAQLYEKAGNINGETLVLVKNNVELWRIANCILKTASYGATYYVFSGIRMNVSNTGTLQFIYGLSSTGDELVYGQGPDYLTSNFAYVVVSSNNTSDTSAGVIITPNGTKGYGVVSLPGDANTKTYVLKCVNGTIEWVEESSL